MKNKPSFLKDKKMINVDNVLEYKREDLEKLTDEQLKQLLHDVNDKADELFTLQQTNKILINGLYGAQGNKNFILFNEKIAQAITGNGRYFIQLVANNINRILSEKLGKEYEFVNMGDTDSVVGSTLIKTSNGDIPIENFYNNYDDEKKLKDGASIKKVHNVKALSMNSNKELEYNNIKYVMKHKVKKRIYRIKTKNNYIDLTEDHSLMVLRDNKLIPVKPTNIIKNDMIFNNIFTSDFKVQDLSVQEIDVYDIEVENNHNFIANNILVHNSVYYRIEPFVELYKKEHPNADIGEIVQFCDDFEEQYIQPIIQNTIDEFSNTLNAYNPSKISAKKETVADSILAVAKKKYIARLRESESTIYPLDSPKLKIMGLELIKSTTPNFTKKYLMQAVNILLDGTNDQLINFIKNIKNEFLKVNINDIVMVSSTNNLDYDLKGTTPIPIAARASIYYNNYITKNNLLNKYNLIQAGDKVKLVYIKDQNPFAPIVKRVNGKNLIPNIIAFSNNEFAKLLKDYIDYDVQFEKSFLNPLKIMSVSINYDVEEKIPDVFDF